MIPIKRDKYKSRRGGNSRILDIHCVTCNYLVLTYQKDGPGNLLRLYMDRIISPDALTNFRHTDVDTIPPLRCFNCNTLLAIPFVYEKEKRNAFRLVGGNVVKRLHK